MLGEVGGSIIAQCPAAVGNKRAQAVPGYIGLIMSYNPHCGTLRVLSSVSEQTWFCCDTPGLIHQLYPAAGFPAIGVRLPGPTPAVTLLSFTAAGAH